MINTCNLPECHNITKTNSHLISKIKTKTKHLYTTHWKLHIQNNNKLSNSYTPFKQDIKYEKYLDNIKDFNKRQTLAKLRTSSHNFGIEKADT